MTNGSYTRYGYADSSTGNYTVTGLPAGSYRVEFNRLSGYNVYSEAQYYNNHPEFQGPGSADPVTLADGQARPGVNASLVKGGSISGKLVDGAGNPLAYCRVQAYTDAAVLIGRETQSNWDGTFTIGGLTTGAYKVRVFGSRYSDCDGGTQYLTNANGGPTSTDPCRRGRRERHPRCQPPARQQRRLRDRRPDLRARHPAARRPIPRPLRGGPQPDQRRDHPVGARVEDRRQLHHQGACPPGATGSRSPGSAASR